MDWGILSQANYWTVSLLLPLCVPRSSFRESKFSEGPRLSCWIHFKHWRGLLWILDFLVAELPIGLRDNLLYHHLKPGTVLLDWHTRACYNIIIIIILTRGSKSGCSGCRVILDPYSICRVWACLSRVFSIITSVVRQITASLNINLLLARRRRTGTSVKYKLCYSDSQFINISHIMCSITKIVLPE